MVDHVRVEVLDWCFETLHQQRKIHSKENPPDDSQESAGALSMDPGESKRILEEREADGFDAPKRIRAWLEKNASPAPGGGSRGDSTVKGNGKGKAQPKGDDQRFNRK